MNGGRLIAKGCTLNAYARDKGLPVEFLQEVGVSEITLQGDLVVRIPYSHADGSVHAVRFRTSLDGDNRFRWRNRDKPCLYGLDQVQYMGDFVVLVEGESDTQTLWYHEVPALGVPGANSWREERDAHYLDSIERIYVVIEPDTGGDAMLDWIAKSNIRDRVWLIDPKPYKDVSDMYCADPNGFEAVLVSACENATSWSDYANRADDEKRRELETASRTLARQPDILSRFARRLQQLGVVGEQANAKILFLALTSRVLQRPVSVAVKGPSSGGKSITVKQVLKFFPASAYSEQTAMTERFIAYDDEPLKHRFIVLYEAGGVQGDTGAYLMRSLLSEAKVIYKTLESTKQGIKARTIVREGPTGLIVTTTKIHLDAELETRILTLTVRDTQEQTRAVIQSLVSSEGRAEVNFAPWHALQEWLAMADHKVTIPYADSLGKKIPPVANRLRRDVTTVLSLIETHAILHQATRERDDNGAIVATLDDYGAVRKLVAPLIAEGVGATVRKTIRETVDAVADFVHDVQHVGATVSLTEIATELKLDKSAASRRVQTAISHGYLKNAQEKSGQPMSIALGEPLPDAQRILPLPEALQVCNGSGEGGDPLPPG